MRSEGLKRKLVVACHDQMFIAEAPIVIVSCGYNIHWNRGEYMDDLSMLVDVSIAFTHLILSRWSGGFRDMLERFFCNEKVK